MAVNIKFHLTLNTLHQEDKWHCVENSYVRGYAFHKDVLYRQNLLIEHLINAYKNNNLSKALSEMEGCYACVLHICYSIILIADKVRSIPLLYKFSNDTVEIADSGTSSKCLMSTGGIDTNASIQFSAIGYLSSDQTLWNTIKQVPAGEYVVIKNNMIPERVKYHTYGRAKEIRTPKQVKLESSECFERVFERTLCTLKITDKILLPLSGGYDSRLMASMCKKLSSNKVICYTYGKKDSFEVLTSRAVANQLGFEWHFVEYSEETWTDFLEGNDFKRYCEYAGCLTGTLHFQDMPALLQLKKEGVLDSDTVIMPGHSGDLLGGSKIPPEIIETYRTGGVKYHHMN